MSLSTQKTEVRFAVVMYGGISLAIYMNGIAQELLRMVRATATGDDENHPLIPYDKLDAVEQVYRKIAYLREEAQVIDQVMVKKNAPLPRSFKIDIVAGTSAGGINGIFLAKALANGQSIEVLKKLWITEGDVNLLLNDKKSLANTGLQKERMPESLFNSRRMYQKLLQAFESMDQGAGDVDQRIPALASNIDLFVTATDIRGLVLPIQLEDSAIYERKYRNVFHFTYSEGESKTRPWNDFNARFNPMLAFAARCTSSFPFAFEPMRFCDIDEVLAIQKIAEDQWSTSPDWKRFFTNYPDKAPSGTIHYDKRPFGDGGYLDNKPFSYAIDAISSRKSDYPVDRKLLYIEPVPEHPENEIEKDGKPNALENSVAALLTLPRRETIREDLNRILERNRLTERIERIISNLELDKALSDWKPRYESERVYADWQAHPDGQPEPLWAKPNISDREWASLDLTDVARRKGPGYVAYQRLEIAAVTDDFGRLIARVGGFDETSAISQVFRNMIKEWRDIRYIDRRTPERRCVEESCWGTQNAYLHSFDLTFPIRRLNFLHRQIDRLYLMNDEALEAAINELLQGGRSSLPPAAVTVSEAKRQELAEFRHKLIEHKKKINEHLLKLSHAGRLLRSRFKESGAADESAQKTSDKPKFQKSSPVYADVMELLRLLDAKPEIAELKKSAGVTAKSTAAKSRSGEIPYGHVIDYFLDKSNKAILQKRHEGRKGEQPGEARMRRFIKDEQNKDVMDTIDAIAFQVKALLEKEIEDADAFFRGYFGETCENQKASEADKSSCAILWSYYRRYSNYDMVIFPMLYGTDATEGDRIDVIRISPEDAAGLIDERSAGLRKLSGRNMANFGAFMETRWRQNDIMWGQLDGAERIINSLVSDHELARKLTGEAHAAIVCETIAPMGVEESRDLLTEPFMHTISGQPDPDGLTRYITALRENAAEINRCGHSRHCALSMLDTQAIRDHYLRKFPLNKGLEPQNALKNAARATTITGKILSGISDQYQISGKKYLSIVSRVGQLALWLVDAAVPRSMKNLMTIHWIQLLYLFEALLIAGSFFFPPIRTFAFVTFGLTLAMHIIIFWFRGLILHRKGINLFFKNLFLMLLILLVLSGAFFIVAFTGMNKSAWSNMLTVHQWLSHIFK